MKANIVKGMAYTTMEYSVGEYSDADLRILPTLHSKDALQTALTVDGVSSFNCNAPETSFAVQQEAELLFVSGSTWLVFFSRPVSLQCSKMDGDFMLQVVNGENDNDSSLVIRLAMVVPPSDKNTDEEAFGTSYKRFLRQHANVYPGALTKVKQSVSDDYHFGNLILNWDIQRMNPDDSFDDDLVVFALPHHQDLMPADSIQQQFCTISLLGPLCPVLGHEWSLIEKLPKVDFRAPRSPDPEALLALVEALKADIDYEIPLNFQKGAGGMYLIQNT
jgi:hypothetical protein